MSRDKTYAAIVHEQSKEQSAEHDGQAAKERMQFQKVTGKTNDKDTAKVAANTRKVASSSNDVTELVAIRGMCRGRSPCHHIYKQMHIQVQRCPP